MRSFGILAARDTPRVSVTGTGPSDRMAGTRRSTAPTRCSWPWPPPVGWPWAYRPGGRPRVDRRLKIGCPGRPMGHRGRWKFGGLASPARVVQKTSGR